MDIRNKVLIVDDDEVGRRALCSCLEASGYEPIEASDGMDALTRLQTGAYALVITDYRMPGLNGLELLHIVKRTWNIPVLFISGDLNEGEELVAKSSDAWILRKPFNQDTLLPMVKLAVLRGGITER
jgi:two-component system, chemotaxis family, chemotaxis protein CheY